MKGGLISLGTFFIIAFFVFAFTTDGELIDKIARGAVLATFACMIVTIINTFMVFFIGLFTTLFILWIIYLLIKQII